MLTPARLNDDELFEVVKVSAVAYLSKNTTPEDLAQTIKKVFGSEYPISESLLSRPKAVEPLIKALGDKSSIVHPYVATALGEIDDKRAVEPLMEALKGKLKAIYDYKLRMEAAKALGVIGDPRAVEPLEKALEDEENKVRKKAKTALNKIRRKSRRVSTTQGYPVP